MNIEEVKHRKAAFEEKLMVMVCDFEKETKCQIKSIEISEMEESMSTTIGAKEITVDKAITITVHI